METKTFRVPNITCDHCVKTIERELSELEGVASVQADPQTQGVTVEWDGTSLSWEQVRHLLEEIHYPPEDQ
ncbi:MAG: heavy-metal-associated domain-containing protein [Acidobacteria bacterium]|nr:heavy-metal-associated domain-containing protein [Acidobacteriota bacterium]MEC4671963.1 heavy-metal-associated domain-containing protein [Nitrospirota bacterium]